MKKSEVNILVVDDDEAIRNVVSQIIERAGYKASAVSTPSEASNLVRYKSFHLAIIDCMLSVVNGIDLAKQLLSTSMKNVPVILMSGIFKDQQFIDDALAKSGASSFLTKPFDSAELIEKINEYVQPLLDFKGGTIGSLLTKVELSKRESKKTLDYIDTSNGYDLMLVFNVLMKSKLSGYLNVTDKNKKLFGFTLCNGKIVDIDTLRNVKDIANLITKMSLVSPSEISSLITTIDKKDPVGFLVQENIISPHMARQIKVDKILEDYKKILLSETVEISFIENKDLTEADIFIAKENFDFLNYEISMQKLRLNWLRDFFQGWSEQRIDLAEGFDNSSCLRCVEPAHEDLLAGFKEQNSLNGLTELFSEEDVLKIAFYLISCRLIYFSDAKADKVFSSLEAKYSSMLEKLDGKNAIEIFRFFGAGDSPNANEVESLYKEFAKVNHPDKISKKAGAKILDLNNKVYSLVSDAYSTLTNVDKRKAFMNKLKESEAKLQIKSEEDVEKAMLLMDQSQFKEALELLVKANEILNTNESWMKMQWAKFKADSKSFKNDLEDVRTRLRDFNVEERQSPYYFFILGITYIAEENYADAEKNLVRALDIDKSLLSVRREIALIKSKQKTGSSKATDLFTGDVTSIISGIFKKKSS